jgi:hypothetical protein
MGAHMILDDLGHQTGRGPSHAGDEMHDLFAPGLALERPLDGFDLPSDTAHARQQLLFIADSMCHAAL